MAPNRSPYQRRHPRSVQETLPRRQHHREEASTSIQGATRHQPSSISLEFHSHQYNARSIAQSSTSHNPSRPLSNTRPLAAEERQYFDSLLRTLRSADLLSIRAIQRNESKPQCRMHIQDEIREFMHNTTTPAARGLHIKILPSGMDPETMLATTADNLVELCRKAGARAAPAKITFTELLRQARENAEKKVRKPSGTLNEGRRMSRTSFGAASRLSADDVDGDGEVGGFDDGMGTPRSRRAKGKRRASSRQWEEESDILDRLD